MYGVYIYIYIIWRPPADVLAQDPQAHPGLGVGLEVLNIM